MGRCLEFRGKNLYKYWLVEIEIPLSNLRYSVEKIVLGILILKEQLEGTEKHTRGTT